MRLMEATRGVGYLLTRVELVNWSFAQPQTYKTVIDGFVKADIMLPPGTPVRTERIKELAVHDDYLCFFTRSAMYFCKYDTHSEDLKDLSLYFSGLVKLCGSRTAANRLCEAVTKNTTSKRAARMEHMKGCLARENKAVMFSFSAEKDMCADLFITKNDDNYMCHDFVKESSCVKAEYKDLKAEYTVKETGPKKTKMGYLPAQRLLTLDGTEIATDVALYANNAGLCDLNLKIGNARQLLKSGQICKLNSKTKESTVIKRSYEKER